MRKFNLSSIFLVILIVIGISAPTGACEKHNDPTPKKSELPGSSLYHLNSKWVNQENSAVNLNNLAGKPRIIAMVYTKCQTACPLLVQDIKSIIAQIPKALGDRLHIDLFSFDSKSENYKSLQDFKVKYKLDQNWSAYSGPKDSVAELAAVLGVQYKKLSSGDYVHSNIVFFVNEKGEVVAKHEGLGRDAGEFLKKIEDSLQ